MTNAARRRPKTTPPEPDRGTPELRAKRQALVGGGDPALSAHPLGVLLARREIDDDLYAAGVRYAFLFGKLFGRTKIVAHYADALIGTRDHTELSDADAARFELALRDCWLAMAPLGPKAKRLLDDIAIYERFPSWLLTDRKNAANGVDRGLLQAALGVLVAQSSRDPKRRATPAAPDRTASRAAVR